MTAQLSRERIEQYLQSAEGQKISDFDSGKLIAVEPDYVIALCRMALAGMDSEPVAYIFKHPAGKLFWSLTHESNKGQSDVMPVYAAPPARVPVKLPTTRLWAGEIECYEKSDVIAAIKDAGVGVSND